MMFAWTGVAKLVGLAAWRDRARHLGKADPEGLSRRASRHLLRSRSGQCRAHRTAARAAGFAVKTGIARFEDNERAEIDGRTFGLVKVVAEAQTGQILGGHIVGEEAGAMIHEIVAAMAGEVPVSLLAHAIHAYPTLSESVKGACIEAANDAGGN